MTSISTSLPTVQPGSFLTLHYRLAGPAGDVINTFTDKPATLSLPLRARNPGGLRSQTPRDGIHE